MRFQHDNLSHFINEWIELKLGIRDWGVIFKRRRRKKGLFKIFDRFNNAKKLKRSLIQSPP